MKYLIKFIYTLLLTSLFIFNASANNKIKIGLVIPLSGEYKDLGESILKSVKLAVNNLKNIKKNGKKKYFFFGDMLELGKKSHIYHKKMTNFINNSDIDKIFVYGKRTSEAYKFIKKSKRGKIINNLDKFNYVISKVLKNGDFLMIKGSNATNLHKVSENFLRKKQYAL